MTLRLLLGVLGGLMLVVPVRAGRDAQGPPSVRAFLAEQFGLTALELSAVEQRKAVARTLQTADGREVATLGAIQMHSSPQFYVDQLRNIVDFKRHDAVIQVV